MRLYIIYLFLIKHYKASTLIVKIKVIKKEAIPSVIHHQLLFDKANLNIKIKCTNFFGINFL